MPAPAILDLSDCTEFRQTLQSRPPAIVHGAVLLLIALIGSGISWAALTTASLVVEGRGRIRPVEAPQRVLATPGPALENRVIEVARKEGDTVAAGDVLLRLDAQRLENDIQRLETRIAAAEAELRKLDDLLGLSEERYKAARAKSEADLARAEQETDDERQRRASELREAESALALADSDLNRQQQLQGRAASTVSQVETARSKATEAREQVNRLKVPVNDSRIEVTRRELALVEKDYAVRRAELESQSIVKKGELEASRRDRDNLLLAKEQCVIRAPIDGVVVAGDVKVGDLLQSGQPAFEIARQHGLRFEVEVPSEDIGHLKPGMPARIRFDAFDYQKFGIATGKVCFISPDSTSSEGEGKARCRYVVRIELYGNEIGRAEDRAALKLGLAGQVEIVTDKERLLTVLLRKIRRTISLGGDS